MKPLDTLVEKYDKSIRFTLKFQGSPNIADLRRLFLPGNSIFQCLVKEGYISQSGTVLVYLTGRISEEHQADGTVNMIFDYHEKPVSEYAYF